MQVAFGTKAHSGWAALIAVGQRDGGFAVVDRRRIELASQAWQKAPYHAAEPLEREAARGVVERGIAAAHRMAVQQIDAAAKRERDRGHEVVACAVLVVDPMPAWSVDEILAVHFRMHKAEGVLFREALARAAGTCGLNVVAVPEKLLQEHAQEVLGATSAGLVAMLAALGKSVGPPWGKDQKDAALAAMVALRGRAQ